MQKNKTNALIKTLANKPLKTKDNFIHLNDVEKSYIVTSGNVYIFAWLLRNNVFTSQKQYICTISADELILTGMDYNIKDKNTQYGFYALLDHDTEISVVNSKDVFACKHPEISDIISNFINKISYAIVAYNKDSRQNKSIDTVASNLKYDELSNLCASDDKKLLWLKPHDAGLYKNKDGNEVSFSKKELIPVTTNISVCFSKESIFDVMTTDALLQKELLYEAISKLDDSLKHDSYEHLSATIEKQQQNFAKLKKAQQSHLAGIFSKLYESYIGKESITPIEVITDDKTSMILLINEICRSTGVEPTLAKYQLLEKLDCNNKNDLEKALNIQNFNFRHTALERNWYEKIRWIMLSTLIDSKQYILIKYKKNKPCYYNPQTNSWHAIDALVAENISDKAITIYRPLPEEPIKNGFELFKQGVFFSKDDLRHVMISSVFIAMISLITPIAMGHLLSEALPSYDIGKINGFLLALLASSISVLVFHLSNSIALLRLESKFSVDIHAAIWMRLLKLPTSFFSEYSVGDLSNRANLISDIRSSWSAATTSSILSILSMVATFFLLFYYSWQLAMIAALLLITILTGVVFFIRSIMPILTASYEYRGKLDSMVFQLLGGISKLRISAKENTLLSLWSNVYAQLTTVTRKFMLRNAIMQSIISVIPLLSNIIIFTFIYYALYKGGYNKDFDLGDFISFNAAFGQLIGAGISITGVLIIVVSTIPMFNRIMPILKTEVESDENKLVIPSFRGNIEFHGVSFRYKENMDYVLKDLTFSIKAGEYIAIVGKSGSGKSTIAKLIIGFEKQNSGVILVDGNNMLKINKSSLRNNVGVVMQNSGIIPGSILDNVAASNSLMTEDEVWGVLEKAGLKDEVYRMPMKLHTFIAEGGAGLSGGQIQRIVIARSLANDPTLLLFDEATSAIDNISQKIIKDTLGKMDVTRIVIAHRLSTVENVDKIYVIDKGNIAESGNYKQLMAKNGFFYELAKRQRIDI